MPKDQLTGTNLDHVSLSGSDLSDADLSRSSLRQSQLKGAKLRGANLSGSDLQGAHLEQADVTGADLSHADLTGASLQGVDLTQAASIDGIILTGAAGVPDELAGTVAAQERDDTVLDVRWDTDPRGHGDGGGSQGIVPAVQRLLDALSRPDWMTDHPEAQLRPQLEQACSADGSPWTIDAIEAGDDLLTVTVAWNRPDGRLHTLRTDVFALIGAVAESATFIEQRLTDNGVEFWIATGVLPADEPFAGHGHAIVLRVGGPAVIRMRADG